MIKIEFPADRQDVALAMGQALLKIAGAEIVTEETKPCAGSCGAKALTEEDKPWTAILEAANRCVQVELEEDAGFSVPLTGDEKLITSKTFPGETMGAGEEKAETDSNGVEFNGMFCGTAKDPLYCTGKRTGQWKKRKGVADGTYDHWYAEQLNSEGARTTEEQPVNVAAAFGSEGLEVAEAGPTTAGELMVWVSERQASGLITADDVKAAYTAAGCEDAGSLFGDDGASYVPAVFAELSK